MFVSFEQSNKIFVVLVMEKFRNFGNRFVGKSQKFFRIGNPLLNDIGFQSDSDVFFEVSGKYKRIETEFMGKRFQRDLRTK